MRTLLTLLITALVISSCNGQSGAVKDQQGAYKVLEDMKKKGLQPASDGGWTMTCLIDGKPWRADGLYPPAMTSRIQGVNGDSYLSFDDPGSYHVGQKQDLSTHAAEFNPPNAGNELWGGHSGEMEITKVANGWVEGKFHLTATVRNTNKKMEVTDGFFRFAVKTR
jgi:predicted small secreted protein